MEEMAHEKFSSRGQETVRVNWTELSAPTTRRNSKQNQQWFESLIPSLLKRDPKVRVFETWVSWSEPKAGRKLDGCGYFAVKFVGSCYLLVDSFL